MATVNSHHHARTARTRRQPCPPRREHRSPQIVAAGRDDPRGRGLRGPDDAARRGRGGRARAVAVQARRRPARARAPDHGRRRCRTCRPPSKPRRRPAIRRATSSRSPRRSARSPIASPRPTPCCSGGCPRTGAPRSTCRRRASRRCSGRSRRSPEPEHGLEAARTVVAWANGFVGMELAGAFRMGGDVDARVHVRGGADRDGDQRAGPPRATMSGVQQTALIADLGRIVGPDHVLTDPGCGRATRPTGRVATAARRSRVVRPASPEQVVEIVGGVPVGAACRSCRRAATRASSAAASRATARCCSAWPG